MIHKIKCLFVVLTCTSYVENIKMTDDPEELRRHQYLLQLSRNISESQMDVDGNYPTSSSPQNDPLTYQDSYYDDDLYEEPGQGGHSTILAGSTGNPNYQDYSDDMLDESQTGNMNIDNKFKPQHTENEIKKQEAKKRIRPLDIVGFSAVKATQDSRRGSTKIQFQRTLVDSNYGWDRYQSIFKTHYPGLYFFTLTGRGEAISSNKPFRISLMKNAEEAVSIGSERRRDGVSSSASIILNLDQGDEVWLQLMDGHILENFEQNSGLTSFSGFRLGCDMMDSDDITGDILSAIQSIHNTLQIEPSKPSYTTTEKPFVFGDNSEMLEPLQFPQHEDNSGLHYPIYGDNSPQFPQNGGNNSPHYPQNGGSNSPHYPQNGGSNSQHYPQNGGSNPPHFPPADGSATANNPEILAIGKDETFTSLLQMSQARPSYWDVNRSGQSANWKQDLNERRQNEYYKNRPHRNSNTNRETFNNYGDRRQEYDLSDQRTSASYTVYSSDKNNYKDENNKHIYYTNSEGQIENFQTKDDINANLYKYNNDAVHFPGLKIEQDDSFRTRETLNSKHLLVNEKRGTFNENVEENGSSNSKFNSNTRRESYFPMRDDHVDENQRTGGWSDQTSNRVNLIPTGQHLSYG